MQHVTAAAFLSDTRVLTSGTDKLLILWELKSAGENLEAIELARVETKTFLDIVVSPTRFVTLGQNQFQVHDSHSLESSFEHEVNETITSLALSKDGRQLLANVSLKQPRLELYELGDQKATLLRRFKGGHEQ